MLKKNMAIVIVLIIVVVVGAVFWMMRGNNNANNASSNNTSSNSSSSSQSATTITYSSSGFSPSTVTVHSGDKVTLKNTSSQDMQFDSDPHPVHTDDPELNVGAVSPGQSMTFTVNTKGTHGYHNHLNPSQTGTIVVQ